jgi:polysaccharide deacetylase 2 family uncharacterized protein YibQ
MVVRNLRLAIFMGLLFLADHGFAESVRQPTIAIIIDDMGNSFVTGKKLIDLPYPMTFAFLPGRPFTKTLSSQAYLQGKDILLHEPMQNEAGMALGDGGLTLDMSAFQLKTSFEKSLTAIPHVIGINNHMGSVLTTNWQSMNWLMEEVRKHPIFFVDSRTIGSSIAAQAAENHDIPNLSRDVFLDNEQTYQNVQHQFLKLLRIAREKGTAIAIGHPHRVTLDYLALALPKLDRKGISIATVSALWQIKHPGKIMFADRKKAPENIKLASKQPALNDRVN